ncbi:cellulase [Sarracenia purpurea var. burkii]
MGMEVKKMPHFGAPKTPKIAQQFSLLLSFFAIFSSAQAFDYAEALSKSLLYFEAQRSGHLPYNQRVTWRDHSGLTDGLEQGVGDGGTDHYCWQRAEDMTTSRQAYKIDEANPGSDLAGETAAAMAAASIVFRKTNPHYSHLLLHHAQQLFEFGDKYRGKYDESVGVAKKYYESASGYKDELLWAALWVYKATGDLYYLEYIIRYARSFGGITWAISEFTWDIKYAGLQILAAKVFFSFFLYSFYLLLISYIYIERGV